MDMLHKPHLFFVVQFLYLTTMCLCVWVWLDWWVI